VLTLDELIRQQPLIHNDRTRTWGIHTELAEFLDRHVGPDTVALETGAGLSTLVILRKRPRLHVAVQPSADEFAAVVEFANAHEIDTRALQGVVARSQDYLPTAELPPLDLVLIDGDHSFPAPFVDWYYTVERLKIGGLMIVDDIQIATGTILATFMGADPKWETVLVRPERFAVYRKRVDFIHLGDWGSQPFLRGPYPTAGIHLIPHGAPSPRELETELAATRKRSEALATERDEARSAARRAMEQSETTSTLLRARTAERDETAAAARSAMERIRAMESTKFWKLRSLWFRLRRLVGAPGNE
jgi:methyltransferase family protein